MIQISHWSALVPLAWLVWLGHRGKAVPRAYWLIAAGFGVSFVWDIATLLTRGSWAWSHIFAPAQLGLFALACGSVFVPILLVALASVPFGLERPEVLVTALGSTIVVYLTHQKIYGLSLALYCGVGTIFYLLMSTELSTGRFMWFWYPYQGCRLSAFGAFCWSAQRWK